MTHSSGEDRYRMLIEHSLDALAIGCRTSRAAGVTGYPSNRGMPEKIRQTAAHEWAKTTKLHDRTDDAITLDEVERMGSWANLGHDSWPRRRRRS